MGFGKYYRFWSKIAGSDISVDPKKLLIVQILSYLGIGLFLLSLVFYIIMQFDPYYSSVREFKSRVERWNSEYADLFENEQDVQLVIDDFVATGISLSSETWPSYTNSYVSKAWNWQSSDVWPLAFDSYARVLDNTAVSQKTDMYTNEGIVWKSFKIGTFVNPESERGSSDDFTSPDTQLYTVNVALARSACREPDKKETNWGTVSSCKDYEELAEGYCFYASTVNFLILFAPMTESSETEGLYEYAEENEFMKNADFSGLSYDDDPYSLPSELRQEDFVKYSKKLSTKIPFVTTKYSHSRHYDISDLQIAVFGEYDPRAWYLTQGGFGDERVPYRIFMWISIVIGILVVCFTVDYRLEKGDPWLLRVLPTEAIKSFFHLINPTQIVSKIRGDKYKAIKTKTPKLDKF